MNTTSDIFTVMSALPPDVSAQAAQRVARDHWGLTAQAKVLSGERDRNFHLRAADGHEFVLKFANPAEDPAFTDMQIQALRHIAAADPDFAVPRLIPRPDGTAEIVLPGPDGARQRVRLLSWVGGLPVAESRTGPAQRAAYGRAVARLQTALAGFTHPASGHQMAWDLQHALRLRDITFTIPHDAVRGTLTDLLDEFEALVTPALPRLPRQIVHNDLNRMNVLVDPAAHDRVVGVIDFGDISLTAIIFDIAIAAVSLPPPEIGPAEAIGQMVAGYHARHPLSPEEAALLPLLMATRIGMGTTLASWHRHTQPDNPHFDLSEAALLRRLAFITALRAPAMAHALNAALATA